MDICLLCGGIRCGCSQCNRPRRSLQGHYGICHTCTQGLLVRMENYKAENYPARVTFDGIPDRNLDIDGYEEEGGAIIRALDKYCAEDGIEKPSAYDFTKRE